MGTEKRNKFGKTGILKNKLIRLDKLVMGKKSFWFISVD
jgi:hypothetical protein